MLDTSLTVTTFGEDPTGELYLSDYGASGELYRLVSAASVPPILTVSKTGIGTGRITSSPTALECGGVCGAQLAASTVVALTATPDAGWSFGGWSGDADCADGSVTLSADRICTAKFGNGFTDDPVAAGTTLIKAVHITELRSRIDALRGGFTLSPYPWTDPTLTVGSSAVQAVHVAEMRTALNEAYAAAKRTPPSYTNPAPTAGGNILAVQISELRSAVVALE